LKLANVILQVKDLERSTAFYKEALGLKQTGSVEGEFAFFDAGSASLAIRETGRKVDPGDTEVVFEVPDVLEAFETLKSHGIVFSQPPRSVTGNQTSDLFATDFRDPDGHVLSITSWVPRPAKAQRKA